VLSGNQLPPPLAVIVWACVTRWSASPCTLRSRNFGKPGVRDAAAAVGRDVGTDRGAGQGGGGGARASQGDAGGGVDAGSGGGDGPAAGGVAHGGAAGRVPGGQGRDRLAVQEGARQGGGALIERGEERSEREMERQ
jgi:hypothetical protein